jgi:hypothetical protein
MTNDLAIGAVVREMRRPISGAKRWDRKAASASYLTSM